ncbi:hypothetical protein [Bifidobacterium mongoliense]|uniref:hypothetical protein n=1 Tax=Bifidobacterium mongoliense TaxID=518643 RepID=UPI002648CDC9|nr:hypothetical protein [Bifidobacterium mongoliense]MDN5979929.1 hypothetical protein [Bifidobacterium mongoliense]
MAATHALSLRAHGVRRRRVGRVPDPPPMMTGRLSYETCALKMLAHDLEREPAADASGDEHGNRQRNGRPLGPVARDQCGATLMRSRMTNQMHTSVSISKTAWIMDSRQPR